MSSEPNQLNMLQSCAKIHKPRSAVDLVNANSNSMAKALQMVGAESCKQGSAIVITPWGGGGGNYSQGCEQVAVIASAIDVSQRVFNCTIQNLSKTVSTSMTSTYKVQVKIGAGFKAQNCTVRVISKSAIRLINYSEMTTDVKVAMQSELKSTLDTFAKNLQDDKKSGLFVNAEGQKAMENFTSAIDEVVVNQSLSNVVSNVMSNFENTNTLEFEIGANSSFQFVDPDSGRDCINISADQILELIAQTIVNDAIDLVFRNELAADVKTILANSNTRVTEGFTLPNIGVFAVIGVIVLIVLVLMFLKRPGMGGLGGTSFIPGNIGKIMGIILLIIGVVTAIAGIIVLLLKKGLVLGIGLIIGGILLAGAGLMLFIRSRVSL